MIYLKMLGLRLNIDGKYESSLEEFHDRFLKGNVFESAGLYDWYNELKKN